MPKPDNLANRMAFLLSTRFAADVQFLVGGEEKEVLSAHKAILGPISDVFEAMFRFDAENAKKEAADKISPVVVTDVEPGAFKAMLYYIYTDDMSGLNGENAMALLYAAKKYNIAGLVEECVAFPVSELQNVFLAFAEARLLDEKDFAARCLAYIDENAVTLIHSEAFLEIDQNLLCEILGRDQLKIGGEIAIWNAALRWADAKCRQKGKECSAQNRRTILGPALYLIRFPLIPSAEFCKNIVPNGVLTQEKLIGELLYRAHPDINALPKQYPLFFATEHRAHLSNDRNQKFKGTLMMTIENLSDFAQGDKTNNWRLSDPAMHLAGFKWKILAYPYTKPGTAAKYLSFFLKCSNASANKIDKWSVNCSAMLGIVSRQNGTKDFVRKSSGIFNSTYSCCGWYEFLTFEYLMDARNGFCCNDTVILSVDVTENESRGGVE